MKLLSAIKLLFIFILVGFILIQERANEYNVDCLKKEFAKGYAKQDSVHNIMYQRILKGNYKPKKVK